jgi:serine/threonine-protein kinase
VLETPAGEKWPLLSPDGEWLAYASDATGRFEVFVRPYPAPGRVEPVSGEGGSNPVWRPDGRELFFLAPAGGKRRMMAVDFVPGSPPRIGQPHILFEFDPRDLNFDCTPVRCYEVSPDGRQFYVWQNDAPPPLPPVTHINIIENWVEHLKEKAPARK